MTGQLSSVQKSVMVPYSMLIWLKKSTAEKREKRKHIQIENRGVQTPCVSAQIAGVMFPHSPPPLLHCPVQTADQGALQLSATKCVIARSQRHTANFGFPSVGDIYLKCWQSWCSFC